jgi:hypothetical protein
MQRQDVGLERDAVDYADDGGDLLAARLDFARVDHPLRDHLAPSPGHADAPCASSFVCHVLWAVWLSDVAICSIEAAVCTRALACLSMRLEKLLAAQAICAPAPVTL